MARISMAYDHPVYITRHMIPIALDAKAASTAVRKFVAFTDMKIKSISGMVRVAGTATLAGWEVAKSATSVAVITVNDSAALTAITAITSDITLASGDYLGFTTLADSATLAGDLCIEYELVPGAGVTK